MNDLIDTAIASLQLGLTFALTVGVLIVGLQMIFKAIDLALLSIFGEYRRFSDDEIDSLNKYEANRKVYTFSEDEEKGYREYLKRNKF